VAPPLGLRSGGFLTAGLVNRGTDFRTGPAGWTTKETKGSKRRQVADAKCSASRYSRKIVS